MKRRHSFLFLLPSLLLLGACDVRVGDKGVSVGVAEGRASDTWVRTYTLGSATALELLNDNGSIEVSRADGPETEVRIEREVEAGSDDEAAREMLARVEIVENAGTEAVRIAIRRNDEGARGWGGRRQVRVDQHVRLAEGSTASFRTENGSIRFDNVRGRLTASTTNGQISGSVSGAISAATVNGAVQLALATAEGPTEISAINGAIRLDLSSDIKATLAATAINGGITVHEGLNLNTRDGRGAGRGRGSNELSATLNGGGPTITLRTTNGAIRLERSE